MQFKRTTLSYYISLDITILYINNLNEVLLILHSFNNVSKIIIIFNLFLLSFFFLFWLINLLFFFIFIFNFLVSLFFFSNIFLSLLRILFLIFCKEVFTTIHFKIFFSRLIWIWKRTVLFFIFFYFLLFESILISFRYLRQVFIPVFIFHLRVLLKLFHNHKLFNMIYRVYFIHAAFNNSSNLFDLSKVTYNRYSMSLYHDITIG